MARRTVVALLLAAALAAVLLQPSAAAAAAARQEDILYIQCQVRERIAREVSTKVAKKYPHSGKVQVPAIEIKEIAKNVCNLKKQEADWMLRIEIVKKGNRLELVEQQEEGRCNAECKKTVERACQEVMEYDNDVAAFVYNNKPSIDQLIKFLYKDLSRACAKDRTPVPKEKEHHPLQWVKDAGTFFKWYMSKVPKWVNKGFEKIKEWVEPEESGKSNDEF